MIRTNLNPPPVSKCYESNNGISRTEPNQALSVKEIIDRHTAGYATNVERVMVDDDGELEQPAPYRQPGFDLADAYQMAMDPKHRQVMEIYNESMKQH